MPRLDEGSIVVEMFRLPGHVRLCGGVRMVEFGQMLLILHNCSLVYKRRLNKRHKDRLG